MAFRSSAVSNSRPRSKQINMKELEEKVRKAKRDKKIFMILGGFQHVRQALLSRGWIEKIPDDKLNLTTPGTEAFYLALLLQKEPHHFIWQGRSRPVKNYLNVTPLQASIIHEPAFDFTTKDGINNCVKNYRWHHIDGLTDINYQRSHILLDKTSREEFIDDYRRTAFTSFLIFLNSKSQDFKSLFTTDDNGISTECVDFAIKKIELLIKMENHADLDTSQLFDVCARIPKNQKEMLTVIRQVINGSRKLKYTSNFLMDICKATVQHCVGKILKQWPYMKYDGVSNVWIMKPIGHSMGNGVVTMKSLEKILEETRSNPSKTFIVQKYVENLLLVHKRKFDMRIYFMVFIREGFIEVWLYKDCYIKFSSKPFQLDNLHRSIHLTNFAVQKHFMDSADQVPGAKENMWSLAQLVSYFESIGKPNVWKDEIYAAIKKNILAVVLASLGTMELNVNNFELNGADFMVGFDYQPILIEINARPALFLSQYQQELITKRLLEDVVKVVVDRQSDPQASTGDFEMIYTQKIPKATTNVIDLPIDCKRLEKPSARYKSEFNDRPRTPKIKPIDVKMNTATITRLKGDNDNPLYFREQAQI